MKRALAISMGAYTVMCIGATLWAFIFPESYGKWNGRLINGVCSAFEKEEIK